MEAHEFVRVGQQRFAEKRHLDALTEFSKALRLSPDSAEVLTLCAEVLSDFGLHASALHAHKCAAKLEPQDPNVNAGVAISMIDQRRFGCAERWCKDHIAPVVRRRVEDLQSALKQANEKGPAVTLPPQLLEKELWPLAVLGSRFMQVSSCPLC
jgi:Flp pilus assembly protein TadD